MSAKARFLKKLQDLQPCCDSFSSRAQADIAAFCQRMDELREKLEEWLEGTCIHIETSPVTLSESLIGGGTFRIPGISLRYNERLIRFTPVFLYAPGATGGVDAALFTDGKMVHLRRLFMRSGEDVKNWTCSPAGNLVGSRSVFSEETFFDIIVSLLPS